MEIKRRLAAGRKSIHQAGANPVHGGFADLCQGIAGPAGELFSLARGLFLRFTRGAGGGVQRGDRGVVLFLRDPRGTKRGAERQHLFAVALLFRGRRARKLNTLLHKALIFAFGFAELLARGATATTAASAGTATRWRGRLIKHRWRDFAKSRGLRARKIGLADQIANSAFTLCGLPHERQNLRPILNVSYNPIAILPNRGDLIAQRLQSLILVITPPRQTFKSLTFFYQAPLSIVISPCRWTS